MKLLMPFKIHDRHVRKVKMEARSNLETLVVVVGPESSGTRIITSYLSQHPLVLGTPDATSHHDVLDPVWHLIERAGELEAAKLFPRSESRRVVVTRRSLPHAKTVGGKAEFEDFADLTAITQLGFRLGLNVVFLVTTRSPAAQLGSWTLERASTGGKLEVAKKQYLSSYRHVFAFLAENDIPFAMVSLEALVLDGQAFMNGLFQLLGLHTVEIKVDRRINVNRRRYEWFSMQRNVSFINAG